MDGNKLYPLTHPQQRIWYSEKLHPGTGMWNNAGTIKVKGSLDIGLLERAVNHAIRYNEALRICITQVDGEPFQYVRDFEYTRLDVIDFSRAGISALYEWDSAQSQENMPLLDCGLFYFAILKTGEQEFGLYAKIHHIISDAWSIVMVCNQILESYDRLLLGEGLQELQRGSYIAYIAKEQEYLASKRFAYDEAALSEIFAGLPEPTVLKQKQSRYISTRARRKACILNKTITEGMRAYCEQKDSTIFALYLAGLCVYINRILGKDDIIIGVPVFNRTTPEEKNTAGMFVSTVPVRIQVRDDMDFDSFVEAVSNEWFRMLKHQKYPYEMLLAGLRSKNKNLDSLYDVTLSYQNARFEKHTQKFTYEGRWHFAGSQAHSLSIHINDREGEGRLIVDYDHLVPLFSSKEIEYIHTHCETILQDALLNPSKKLYELNVMPAEELGRVLHSFNASKAEYPMDRGLDALFRQQVNRTPDATALVADGEAFTYRRLDSMVNAMAHYLIGRGLQRNSIVGIMICRDYTLFVSILAVLRAGGAYLPIDPEFPAERVRFILTESASRFVIASPQAAPKCGDACPAIQTDIIESLPAYAKEIPANNNMGDLCYVLYTSGSTGKPKGVMVEQGSVVNFFYAVCEVLDYTQGNNVLSSTSITFDVFAMELYPTLLAGGTIVLAADHEQNIPRNLIALIGRTQINKLILTPSRMQLFLTDKGAEEALKNVREIILLGEALPPRLMRELQEKTPARLYNFYGPTEATVVVTYKDVTNSSTVNIGKPLPNVSAYILDKHKNPVPIGVIGELYFGGIAVARGYLNRPDLTQAAFMENPLDTNDRIYKTGDIARWFPMGEIEFLGRMDEQVKIRGLRIELGEISAAVSECAGVEKAVVVDFRKDDAHFLCAYYTKNGLVDEAELRRSLRKRLPVYMIPSFFIAVDFFLMTPSGKLDKSVLPRPESSAAPGSRKTDARRMSETEKKMAGIWRKVLKIKKVAREDNFFELGGDSLAVIRVQNELLQYGIELKIQDFYELQTLDTICTHIDSGVKSPGASPDGPSILLGARGRNAGRHRAGETLAERILAGGLSGLDSAALTYLPDDPGIPLNGLDASPVLYNYMDTGFGVIGVIALPVSGRNIYSHKNKLVSLSVRGAELAKELGAKAVSLTGLIPSATDYGRELARACAGVPGVRLTTGHTTTAASVILSLERLLRESGRSIADEDVCVLGLGSIGTTVTKLLLSVLPHPSSVTLCDIAQKSAYLNAMVRELKEEYGFGGRLRIACAKGTALPDEVYEATLIIGATNVPDLLDVNRLRPGALIIDDSGPHCFSKEAAMARLNNAGDILFTEGGVLHTPRPLTKKMYLPPFINPDIIKFYRQHFLGKNEITGCILSGLLSVKYEQLAPVVGPVAIADCQKHYKVLKQLHFDGALLHCDEHVIPQSAVDVFKSRRYRAAR